MAASDTQRRMCTPTRNVWYSDEQRLISFSFQMEVEVRHHGRVAEFVKEVGKMFPIHNGEEAADSFGGASRCANDPGPIIFRLFIQPPEPTTSTALGKPCTIVNNQLYGIIQQANFGVVKENTRFSASNLLYNQSLMVPLSGETICQCAIVHMESRRCSRISVVGPVNPGAKLETEIFDQLLMGKTIPAVTNHMQIELEKHVEKIEHTYRTERPI